MTEEREKVKEKRGKRKTGVLHFDLFSFLFSLVT